MFLHGAASSRTPYITVVIVLLIVQTLSDDPWCRVKAPCQVILSFQVYWLFPPFFLQISPMSSYVFRQGNLPKLNLQIDRGSDFSAWQTQWE